MKKHISTSGQEAKIPLNGIIFIKNEEEKKGGGS
jgi:hypothetical protein